MRNQVPSIRRRSWLLVPCLVSVAALLLAEGGAGTEAPPKKAARKTAKKTASKADAAVGLAANVLKLAKLKKKDVVYELGCGDGSLLIALAKDTGAHGVGFDADPASIEKAAEAAKARGVDELVKFRKLDAADLADGKLSLKPATVVLVSKGLKADEKLLQTIRAGLAAETRAITDGVAFADWRPEQKVSVEEKGASHPLHLYRVPPDDAAESLAPFVPTPMEVVQEMLKLAEVTKDDVIYDLGCGDGRIVVEAAKAYGARGVGIDYDPKRCEEARQRAEKEGVADRVEIRRDDVTKADFSDATVISMYLLPSSNNILKPKLLKLRPGTRIVSHDFDIDGWKPLKVQEVEQGHGHTLYLWKVGEGEKPED